MNYINPIVNSRTVSGPAASGVEVYFSAFEYWPDWLFYAPVVLHWIVLGIKYGDMSLPTLANPGIETGGMCGESKISILDQIPDRDIIARYASINTCANISPEIDLASAEAEMKRANLHYPLVAKPDIGCNGTGVKIIDRPETFKSYLAEYPRNTRVLLQELIAFEHEAGVFFVRRPGDSRGRITSLTLKSSPYVTGNGFSTLLELINRDPRASQIKHIYLSHLAERLSYIPYYGESVRLLFAGNHCKGSIFRNGNAHITSAMTERFDEIACRIPEFYFGRFDVRYESLPMLKKGEGFRLIELNGVGSEATHIWDKDMKLFDAYRDLFMHYRLAFEIGAANRNRGFLTTGLWHLKKLWRRQKHLMKNYPLGD